MLVYQQVQLVMLAVIMKPKREAEMNPSMCAQLIFDLTRVLRSHNEEWIISSTNSTGKTKYSYAKKTTTMKLDDYLWLCTKLNSK